jgi:hemoglobin
VTLRPVWICLLLVGCGSNQPAPANPQPVEDNEPAAPPAAEPAPPPAAEPAPAPAPVADKPLFERLGGLPAITAVVDEFVNRTTADPRIKQRFFNTDAVQLKKFLVEFVASASGGGVKYTGRDMASAHAGMDLVDDEFTALVENLIAALDKFKVPEREKGELLGALGPLKPQIVVPADKLKPIPDAKLAKVSAIIPSVKDPQAAELLQAAVTAGKRGQRSYAEQLFSRAELIVGPATLASASEVFREGAPPRIHTALKPAKDNTPQPATAVGKSDDDNPARRKEAGMLHGTLTLEGKPLSSLALVMLWPKGGKAVKRAPKFRVIEQRNKTFAPHLMAVPIGSTVAFPNFDSIYHNVFSLSAPQRFDLGLYKSGDMRQVVFDKPGIIRLGCNIHANMSAYLIVVDAPHYVVSEQDGAFSFKSLRPGKYRVQAWSEQSSEPMSTEITIKAGDNALPLDLKGGASQGPSEDKFGAARAP